MDRPRGRGLSQAETMPRTGGTPAPASGWEAAELEAKIEVNFEGLGI
jgi:hypothetical protein